MKVNLILKRVAANGQLEAKIVQVDIPEITTADGWSIMSWCHSIEYPTSIETKVDNTYNNQPTIETDVDMLTTTQVTAKIEKAIAEQKRKVHKIHSSTKLVRVKDRIFVARRRPSDKMSKDCIFIDDTTRISFFNTVKEIFGTGTSEYTVYSEYHQYNYWNNFIDTTYKSYKEGLYVVQD